VKRVARKFGLIAAAGELAITYKVFPFEKKEALRAAQKYFKIWLKLRDGVADKEIINSLNCIKEHFQKCSENKYIDIDSGDNRIQDYFGYRYKESFGQYNYFMLLSKFNQLISNVNKNQLKNLLAKLDYIEKDRYGKIKEIKSIKGRNFRGLIFKPYVWENEKPKR
jgi:putative DNA primase/helicase